VRVGRVRATACLEHELVHARELTQDLVESVHDRKHALQRLFVLIGVQLSDFRGA